ncbi:MAG: peptidase MA family metallohydrolase, partial [Anaerolineae bacterium]
MKRILILVVGLGLVLLTGPSAHAQSSSVTVLRNETAVQFPSQVTFQLEFTGEVTEAALTYDVVQTSCLDASAQVPVEVNGQQVEWTWVMSRSGNPPPGAELWWEWTLTTADGRVITTPRQTVTLSDDRFDWRTVSAENIHLHWYKGDEVGPLLLDAAVAGLHQLQDEMGIQLQSDVQFYIYGSSQDMRDAVLYIQDWAGGVAFSEYNTILMGVPPNIAADWGRTTVRHELAHLVIGQFANSCVGGHLPTWLNEGLAVYAEGEPDSDTLADIANGIDNNQFEPLRSLNGAFPAHDAAASMAYSESYSVVNFMLNTYGQKKMQQLLLTLAD